MAVQLAEVELQIGQCVRPSTKPLTFQASASQMPAPQVPVAPAFERVDLIVEPARGVVELDPPFDAKLKTAVGQSVTTLVNFSRGTYDGLLQFDSQPRVDDFDVTFSPNPAHPTDPDQTRMTVTGRRLVSPTKISVTANALDCPESLVIDPVDYEVEVVRRLLLLACPLPSIRVRPGKLFRFGLTIQRIAYDGRIQLAIKEPNPLPPQFGAKFFLDGEFPDRPDLLSARLQGTVPSNFVPPADPYEFVVTATALDANDVEIRDTGRLTLLVKEPRPPEAEEGEVVEAPPPPEDTVPVEQEPPPVETA
jgi:hypothetical protein